MWLVWDDKVLSMYEIKLNIISKKLSELNVLNNGVSIDNQNNIVINFDDSVDENTKSSTYQIISDMDLDLLANIEQSNAEIKSQIEALEQSQLRALREMALEPNAFAENKLTQIDLQIKELRTQITLKYNGDSI